MKTRPILMLASVAMILVVAGVGNAFAYPLFSAYPKTYLSSNGQVYWENYPSSETENSRVNSNDVSWYAQWHNVYQNGVSVQIGANWVTNPYGGVQAGNWVGPYIGYGTYHPDNMDSSKGSMTTTGSVGSTYQFQNEYGYSIGPSVRVTDMNVHVVN